MFPQARRAQRAKAAGWDVCDTADTFRELMHTAAPSHTFHHVPVAAMSEFSRLARLHGYVVASQKRVKKSTAHVQVRGTFGVEPQSGLVSGWARAFQRSRARVCTCHQFLVAPHLTV